MNEEELEVHLADLKYQVENLKLLIASVEADLTAKDKEALVAQSTEAWLLTLRKNLAAVEQDTEEAFESRRQLAKLLVEWVSVSRGQDGRPRVEITYRFVPPAGESSLVADFSADGVQSSVEFARAHGWAARRVCCGVIPR